MADKEIEFGSKEYVEKLKQCYNEQFLQVVDIIERNDFYGGVAERCVNFLGEKLGLTQDCHVLDLCSGIGGPARFLARKYGCKVTGIDITEFNYQTAQKRTREAGLDHLVNFVHGNALEIPFPDQSFTHVFGCDAWIYFPDKVQLYKSAYRVLKPKGVISFTDWASDIPNLHFHTEEFIGPNYIESIANYTSMLKVAGFDSIQHYDTTGPASKDILSTIYQQVIRRDKIIQAVGSEIYFVTLDMWAELIAYLSEGRATHGCFIAQKKQ